MVGLWKMAHLSAIVHGLGGSSPSWLQVYGGVPEKVFDSLKAVGFIELEVPLKMVLSSGRADLESPADVGDLICAMVHFVFKTREAVAALPAHY